MDKFLITGGNRLTGEVEISGEMCIRDSYAASLKAQDEAEKQHYTQVLWLDGVERKYIEEVGTMNVFFVLGDEVVTPELQGSILSGITRMSCIEMLKSWAVSYTHLDVYKRQDLMRPACLQHKLHERMALSIG